MAKLEQKTVEEACALARGRYMAMTPDEAKAHFSYELQGFLATMNDRREWPLAFGVRKVVELLDLVLRSNGV